MILFSSLIYLVITLIFFIHWFVETEERIGQPMTEKEVRRELAFCLFWPIILVLKAIKGLYEIVIETFYT